MKQGLERLFWIVGGVLLLPFILHQGIILSYNSSPASQVAHLVSRPAAPNAAPRATEEPRDLVDISQWAGNRAGARTELIALIDRPVAILSIPALKMEVPVFNDLGEVALTLGAGLIPGTADVDGSGNIGLASHRDGHFRHLKNVSSGDLLLLNTARGIRHYRVAEVRVVNPNDTWVLDQGDLSSITLVTCYPFHFVGSAPQRYVVSAWEVQTRPIAAQLDHSVIGGHHETVKF